MRFTTLSVFLFFSIGQIVSSQVTYTEAFPNINFEFPVEIQCPNDNSNRMFVVEQDGVIKVFTIDADVNQQNVTTFLDITDRVSFSVGQEIGLLGLAFHPNFNTNRKFYVYYTAQSPVSGINVRIVLSEFTVFANNMNLADSSSERIIFEYDKNQTQSNHNGGKIAFGPDGYLYISVGDGGGGNDPLNNAQNINNVFGSICRVDIDLDSSNTASANGAYEIPSDNPYVGQTGLDEIYAIGIRNTWKFSFDDSTNRLWGADVGQGNFEEINLIENGNNYGWDAFEGLSAANSTPVTGNVTFPVYIYNHNQGDFSVTGGYVYRGSQITSSNPSINSKYIFGDFASGRVWALDYNESTAETAVDLLFDAERILISTFGVDQAEEHYFADYTDSGKIYKIVDGTTPPSGTVVNGFGAWRTMENGIENGVINAIATDDQGNVYVGGSFSQIGGVTVNNLAVWNSNSGWSPFGSGTNGTVNAIQIDANGLIYVGGTFSQINGLSSMNIARWNGSNWSSLNNGIDGIVAAMAIDSNNQLFVGGIFESIDGTEANNIARWNGSSWSVLSNQGSGIAGMNNEIRSLAVDGANILYAGGNFDTAGGITANRIASWDGANWSALGSGTSGFVEAIVTNNDDVFIGGNFTIAGGLSVNKIARWNTTSSSWSGLNQGLSNSVTSLVHNGTHLFAAGLFELAFNSSTGIVVNNIARWNNSNGWQAMGSATNVGVDVKINAIALSSSVNERLFVGGNFSSAGAVSTNNIAIWESENVLSIDELLQSNKLPYPNPVVNELRLPVDGIWSVYNELGMLLHEERSGVLDMKSYKAGVYYLKNENGQTHKIIKIN